MSNDKTELEFLEMKKMVDSVHQRHLDHRKNLIKDGTDKMEFWSADLSPDEEETFNRVLEWIVAEKRWYDIPGLFGACALYGSDWCKKAYLKCKDLIPLDALYNVTINVYAEDGFDFPKEIIAEIKELRPLDYLRFLPRRLKAKDVVRVFRVSSTPPNEISNLSSEVSWWANPQAAFGTWIFRQEKCSQTPWYIYTAHISHNDIIAYNPYLDEVMQLNNVFDVHRIDPVALHKLCCLTDFPFNRTLQNDLPPSISVYHVSLCPLSPDDSTHVKWTIDPKTAYSLWKHVTLEEHKTCYIYHAKIPLHNIREYEPDEGHSLFITESIADLELIDAVILGGSCRMQDEYSVSRMIEMKQEANNISLWYDRYQKRNNK